MTEVFPAEFLITRENYRCSLVSSIKAGSAKDLADKMVAAVRECDPEVAKQARDLAREELPGRIRKFGRVFQDITLGAIMDVTTY